MQQQLPLISIVMATHNGERYLPEQLDSILQQTYPNIEIVVTDDCSSDSTAVILDKYSRNHGNIHIYRNETQLGFIKNFEKAMSMARGELIAPSDQDDIWNPEKLDTLYRALGNHELVYSNSLLIDHNGQSLGRRMSDIKNMIDYTDCLMYAVGAWAPGHAMLFRATILEKCSPFPTLVTHDFWLGFVASCYRGVHYVDQELVLYRQHDTNVIGANTQGRKSKASRKTRQEKLEQARARMQLLFEKCPVENTTSKQVLYDLHRSYRSFSISNNWLRMATFMKNRKKLLAYKKKSNLMQILFCLKMFFKID